MVQSRAKRGGTSNLSPPFIFLQSTLTTVSTMLLVSLVPWLSLVASVFSWIKINK
jgi:hypothetical protein